MFYLFIQKTSQNPYTFLTNSINIHSYINLEGKINIDFHLIIMKNAFLFGRQQIICLECKTAANSQNLLNPNSVA